MGTRLIQQRRGKGSPAFKSPGHRFFGNISYDMPAQTISGIVKRFVQDPARTTLVVEIVLQDNRKFHALAAEGLAIGDVVEIGGEAKPGVGNVTRLANIPDGTPVFNVELRPGDGGKFARASGSSCHKLSQDEDSGLISLQLSSKQVLNLSPNCFATVGVACGGGRLEKPFMKAGTRYHKMHALNRYYPHNRGRSMSAYDHPYGGKTGGRPTCVSRGTPPGRKAGHIAASRTGRRKGKGKGARKSSEQGKA